MRSELKKLFVFPAPYVTRVSEKLKAGQGKGVRIVLAVTFNFGSVTTLYVRKMVVLRTNYELIN